MFEVPSATDPEKFLYYARAAVAFVLNKVETFGGCEFRVHLNETAASHPGLLRRLSAAARGRITFVCVAFTPRPKARRDIAEIAADIVSRRGGHSISARWT